MSRVTASIADYRLAARAKLPRFLFEYIDGGSYSETTLRRNVEDLSSIALRQRILRDVSAIDLSTTVFGEALELPLALAPIGLAGMNARRGEVQAVRAAEQAGVPFCLSTVSVCPIAEVAAASTRLFWFQMYMIRDRAFMQSLLDKAEAAGCTTIILTVDMPMPGSRYRDYRTGLAGAPGLRGALRRFAQAAVKPAWAWDVGVNGRPHHLGNVAPVLKGRTGLNDFLGWMRDNFDPSITWHDLEVLRARWKGSIVVKGILDPADAVQARSLGADGIVVSNHGGRQLDGVPSTARALPAIVDALGGGITVLADGGIRSGLDVARMIALGADAVLIGRAWAWALAAHGEAGVSHMLDLIRAELSIAMALSGTTRIADIDRSLLVEG